MFVDASGRRRRRVRRIGYAVGAACLTYTCLVGASVIGQPARPGALAPLPAVRQTQPPEPHTAGVPLPPGNRPNVEAVPMRVQRREPAGPPPRRPPRAPLIESTPLPAPTTPRPAPTDPPSPTEPPPPTDPPPTEPSAPEPTEPPAPEPTDPPTPEPTPELPLLGPIHGLLSSGSARR